MSNQKIAIAFVRSTNTDQNQRNESITAQRTAITEYAKKYDIEIQQVFESTAKNASMTLWNMLSYCMANPNVKYVLVRGADRITRSFTDYSCYTSIFAKYNVTIIATTQGSIEDDTPMGHFMKSLTRLVGELDSSRRSEITKQGMSRRAEQGYAVHQPPFGYMTTKTPGLFEPDFQGKILGAQLKGLAVGSTTIDVVAEKLALSDPFDSDPKPWSIAKVKRLASNPYYAGYISHQGSLYKGKHVPILTLDEQRQLIEMFAQ